MIGIDDSLDVFAEHGIGGIVGLLFNAFFAEGWVIGLDGVSSGTEGGFMDHNYKQLYIQVAYIVATSAYSFVVSALIAKGIDLIPGLHLRASEEAELLGLDDDQHGEFSYDYVEVRRDFLAWSPQSAQQADASTFTPQLGEKQLSNLHSRLPSVASSRDRAAEGIPSTKASEAVEEPTPLPSLPSEPAEPAEPAKSA